MKSNQILVITLSNIGDVIVTTPVMAALKSQFPEARLTVVCGPRTVSILKGSRMIDELVVYDKHARLSEKLKFIIQLRRKKYDLVVDLRHTAIPYLVSAKQKSPIFRGGKVLPLHEKHLVILKAMKLSTEIRQRFDFFTPEEEASVLAKIQKRGIRADASWIVIAPFAASELKTWTFSGFKALVTQLLESFSGEILLVGGEREKSMMGSLAQIHPQRVINLAGETSLRELSALVNRAALLVANDSSVVHLGFEMNRPTVAIFGPTDPALSGRKGPRFRVAQHTAPCVPCEQAHCRLDRRVCLDDLAPETIFQACQELLSHALQSSS
ncbi:MAG: glycosyltransferase family 9 protein [Candidatus Omnitrophica bacterium]|nr:glycosyltransferase family 9 protein [Candidatus Omnitrophota bacterium]